MHPEGDTRFFIIRLKNIDQNMEIYCTPQILGEYAILLLPLPMAAKNSDLSEGDYRIHKICDKEANFLGRACNSSKIGVAIDINLSVCYTLLHEYK